MKHTYRIVFLAMLSLMEPPTVWGRLPQPNCIFYGEARDEFGWPLLADATVTLKINGQVYQQYPIIGLLAPAVNFLFRVPLDDGNDDLYDPSAARAGDTVEITVQSQGQEHMVIETGMLPDVGQPGDIIFVNVTQGTDTDGDGIPDEWEQFIVDVSSSDSITTVNDVDSDGDFDGDGASNIAEFRAGTFADLSLDYFHSEDLEWLPSGWLRMRLLTTPGKSYQVAWADYLTNVWMPSPYAMAENGPLGSGYFTGDGNFVNVYLQLDSATNKVYRLEVQ